MVKRSLFFGKHSNSRHRELKLLPFRRAGRKIIGCLKNTRLILQILRPDIDVERMMQELIYESPLRSPNQIQVPNAMGLQYLHFKNEPASSSFNRPTNLPLQSHPMIILFPPQQQGNGDGFSPMSIVSQQEVYDASFFQDLHSSPPIFMSFNQSNTSGVNDFSNEPCWDHMNFWPANGSIETFDSLFMNLEVWSNSGIQTGHGSFLGSVPSISVQHSGDFTGIALNWRVLKAILGLRMRLKKIVAAKRTDKIE